jgi:hypothetical protein
MDEELIKKVGRRIGPLNELPQELRDHCDLVMLKPPRTCKRDRKIIP